LICIALFYSITFTQTVDDKGAKETKKSHSDCSIAIDTTWGEGLTTVQNQEYFDNRWYKVDQTWGGFPNLTVNWDSLITHYRPIIEAGVSRGRFQGIMNRLTRALNEIHVRVIDPCIDLRGQDRGHHHAHPSSGHFY